jgi:hypothetical protein
MLQWTDQENESRQNGEEKENREVPCLTSQLLGRNLLLHLLRSGQIDERSSTDHSTLTCVLPLPCSLSETLALDYASLNSRDGMERSSSSMSGEESTRKKTACDSHWHILTDRLHLVY